MGFLEDILARKKTEVQEREKSTTLEQLKKTCEPTSPVSSLIKALESGPAPRIIAEIKRASPSKGNIRPDLDAAEVARSYRDNGAAAISVLTDGPGFAGSIEDLRKAREGDKASDVPLLRKDFIIDPYQVWESRAAGADALLLIVAALSMSPVTLEEMIAETNRAGIEALVEVHDEAEFKIALDAGAKLVGANNRNLRTFDVETQTTLRLAPLAEDAGVLMVAESGIRSPEDIKRYMDAGLRAFLIGEALVTAPDPGKRLGEFIKGN